MLSYRILTAVILIPLVLWAIFALPQLPFSLVTAAILLYAAWEWANFMDWTTLWWRLLYVLIVAITLLVSLLLPPWVSFVVGALWWFGIIVLLGWVEIIKKIPRLPKTFIAVSGLLALIPCWQVVLVLHLRPKWLVLLFVIVWLTDTIAYFGGRLWGRRKLAPTISPNKTREGVYTVFAVGILSSLGLQWWLLGALERNRVIAWTSLMIVTVIASIVGDLFESLLKRQSGLKDSGGLLPGHGGLLDRIDSLLAAAPVFICSAISLKLI